jgi:TPR repeat protein
LEGRCRYGSESCTFRHVDDAKDVQSEESSGEEEAGEGTLDVTSITAGASAASSNRTSTHKDRNSNATVTGDGFSMVPMVDHLLESAGGVIELKELLQLYLSALGSAVGKDCDVTKASFDIVMGPAKWKAQKQLQARSDAGDPTAQYLWGKLLECQQVMVLDKVGYRKNAALKIWMMSAQSGHAMAMAGLGLMHRNEGEQSTANHWWEKAIGVAEMP